MNENKDKSIFEYTMGRSVTGAICGLAVIVLAILGLVHIIPEVLLAVATIVFGVTLLFKGALVSTEYSKLLAHLSGSKTDKFELGGGMSLELMTGIAGIVLGILALLHIVPEILIPVAVIVFGLGTIMGSGVVSRLNTLKLDVLGTSSPTQSRVLQDMVSATVGAQVLAGIAAIVLGILGLTGFAPHTLCLIALLVLGANSLLSGSAVTEKMLDNIRG